MLCGSMTERLRDRPLEREFITEAGRTLWYDPDHLADHAQARADETGSSVRVGPDWLAEALEEAADFANYVAWDLEQHFDAEGREELLTALGELGSAYERVRRVRGFRRA